MKVCQFKKMKDGSIKESELLEEANTIFKNMKSMPGMDNFDSLFKSMNLETWLLLGILGIVLAIAIRVDEISKILKKNKNE